MRIDCGTPDLALKSLSDVFNVDVNRIRLTLQTVKLDDIYLNAYKEMNEDSCIDSFIHNWLCSKLNSQPSNPQYVAWFHFTKTFDFDSFLKNGLLPTDKALPIIKKDIYRFVASRWTAEKRDDIWQQAIDDLPSNDKIKFFPLLGGMPDLGPNGMLVKDVGLYPERSSVGEFQKRPEMVEGILRTIDKKHGTFLFDNFEKEGQSCVVTFLTHLDRELYRLTSSILGYLHGYFHDEYKLDGQENYDAEILLLRHKRYSKLN